MQKSFLSETVVQQVCLILHKSAAMCDLLHAHARGETDLTEDQLASVVTDVSDEARAVLSRLVGGSSVVRDGFVYATGTPH